MTLGVITLMAKTTLGYGNFKSETFPQYHTKSVYRGLIKKINCSMNFRVSPCIITVNHFYYPTNALNYTKLKRLKSTLYKSLKDIKLKITPTCFGSYVIHHQGAQSCA